MRILLGLTEVSGFFARLKAGFDELGVEATHVSLQVHPFSYSPDMSHPLPVRCARWAVARRVDAIRTRARWRSRMWLPLVVLTRGLLLIWSLQRFDVFILGAGSSFFGLRELPLLRWLGKTVIYTLHGTDARPPYIDGFFDPEQYGMSAGVPPIEAEPAVERARRWAPAHAAVALKRLRQVQRIERYATAVICAPNYAQFLSKPFVSFFAIGLPTVLPPGFHAADVQSSANMTNPRVRILHAPSQALGKGSREIRKAIATLQEQGHPIEFVEISGKTNAEVFGEIAQSDLVIDQFYSDTPMAAFAAEAALLGKPAVVSGYFSSKVVDEIAAAHRPPSAFCLPSELASTVSRLVQNRSEREELGRRANSFVLEQWNPAAVAKRILALQDGVPPGWRVDPATLSYLHGIGLSDDQVRANVAALIKLQGAQALALSHKPGLEQQYLKLARADGG